MQLLDRDNVGLPQLQQVADEMVLDGNKQSGLTKLPNLIPRWRADHFADVDQVKAKSLGVPLDVGKSSARQRR